MFWGVWHNVNIFNACGNERRLVDQTHSVVLQNIVTKRLRTGRYLMNNIKNSKTLLHKTRKRDMVSFTCFVTIADCDVETLDCDCGLGQAGDRLPAKCTDTVSRGACWLERRKGTPGRHPERRLPPAHTSSNRFAPLRFHVLFAALAKWRKDLTHRLESMTLVSKFGHINTTSFQYTVIKTGILQRLC